MAELLIRRASSSPDAVALRVERRGIWERITWSRLETDVFTAALGLRSLGVGDGDRLAFMGEIQYEFAVLDLAAQSIGSVVLGVYATSSPEDVAFVMQDSEPAVFVAEDQEYVDKLLDAEDITGAALTDKVVVIDDRGMFAYTDARLLRYSDFIERAARADTDIPAEHRDWRNACRDLGSDRVTRISYTSGTTGHPKGAMIRPRNVLATWGRLFGDLHPAVSSHDRTVAYMPIATVADAIFSFILPAMGAVAHIPDDPANVIPAMVETKPTILLGFPGFWEGLAADIQVDVDLGGRLKRTAYNVAMSAREAWEKEVGRGALLRRWGGWMSYQLVMAPLLDKFGLRAVRLALSGGGAISPELVRQWRLWGVEIHELYGMTESGGLATVQYNDELGTRTSGRPVGDVRIQISEAGEVLIGGPGVFAGYWNRPDATASTLDDEGWLHSGDLGKLDEDGRLVIFDRMKEIQQLTDGTRLAPTALELLLKLSPYIRDAVVVSDGRPFVSALVELHFATTSEWARQKGITYTSFGSLARHPAFGSLLDEHVTQVNEMAAIRGLPPIGDFRVLPKELDPEESDEVTPSRKVKRGKVAAKFAELVEDMYGETPETIELGRRA